MKRLHSRRLLPIVLLLIVLFALIMFTRGEDDVPPNITPLPDDVVANIRQIYAAGQTMGNQAQVFALVGDSITVSDYFLHPIGAGIYDLAEYQHLQLIIDYFNQPVPGGNSFTRPSAAAGVGWAAWGVFEASLNTSADCVPGEMPLLCEYRVLRPAIALIMFGTNDSGYRTPQQYRQNLQRIVDISVENGIIPLLSTIPDRPEMPATIAAFNQVVRELAETNKLPLWDYHAALQLLPNQGLAYDNLHPSSPPAPYQAAANFQRQNLQYGYVVRNLTALQLLYQVGWYLQES
jgi:hypothetical protein